MLLTTNAKHTRIVKNVFVLNMVINVLVNSFDTHGNTPQKQVISFLPMMMVHAKENSLNVMSNLSRIHSLTRTFSMRITMLSGLQLVSTIEMMIHVHQVVQLQLNINAVVVMLKVTMVPLLVSTINANHQRSSIQKKTY